ncbi:hypothetical protein HY004_02895 [Candidatus Saccharibacteria bacterium]|nr:hypothetical protein [Candidatus Saccharibacteria bacterium]
MPWGSVDYKPVSDFKFLLTPSQVQGIKSFTDELAVTIELARAAGFEEEADWIAHVWEM